MSYRESERRRGQWALWLWAICVALVLVGGLDDKLIGLGIVGAPFGWAAIIVTIMWRRRRSQRVRAEIQAEAFAAKLARG